MDGRVQFPVFVFVSLVVFVVVVRLALRRRPSGPGARELAIPALIVIGGGTFFGKFGANLGLPWWIYYPIPALANVLLPPLWFRMKARETCLYVLLILAAAPAIHVTFSLLLGWKEYMPFFPVPSLTELLRR